MQREFIINSALDMKNVAEDILKIALGNKRNVATVFALHGNLGAGKTTLVKEIGKLLFTSTMVSSPTFVIMKSHKIQNPKIPFVNLVHIDAYRLKEERDSEILRLADVFRNNDNLVFIEWPENIKNLDISYSSSIKLEHLGDTRRKVIITT